MNDNGRPIRAEPNNAARVSVRHKVFEPSELSLGGERVRAHVINVSETGVLVHTEAQADKGREVELRLGDDWYPARVAWVARPRLGLAFVKRLPEDVLAKLLGR
jgi:hypothetical protein